jgi:hypothetical protein
MGSLKGTQMIIRLGAVGSIGIARTRRRSLLILLLDIFFQSFGGTTSIILARTRNSEGSFVLSLLFQEGDVGLGVQLGWDLQTAESESRLRFRLCFT